MSSKRKSVEEAGCKSSNKKSHSATNALKTTLNPAYCGETAKEVLGQAFASSLSRTHDSGAILHADPFTCCFLPTFLQDETFLTGLKDELLEQPFLEKNNDLYQFHQTNDLKTVHTPHIAALRSFLCNDVLQWLKDVTGIPLASNVDITSSRYEYTDVLLCHDDELEGRRIAYMLYLVPPSWSSADGGTLDLFSMDETGQPKSITKSLIPSWNSFVFFEVTPKSYHQVSEIVTPDKCRLSVNGWFYGPSVKRPPPHLELLPELTPALSFQTNDLSKWINPSYLELETQIQVRAKFEEDSEIELVNFLKEDLHNQLAEMLKDNQIKWKMLGPPNKCQYEIIEDADLPGLVQECVKLLRSESFFLLLSSLTGLSLHPMAGNDQDMENEDEGKAGGSSSNDEKSKCHVEVSRWRQGSYTLVYDKDEQVQGYALDVLYFFNCHDWKNKYGGFTSYIVKGEDEELLSVFPTVNSMALVYRDSETASFVKYVNKQVEDLNSKGEFQTFRALYVEQ